MIDLSIIQKIKDEDIRNGLTAAIEKNLLAAHTDKAYPGHFTVVADGSAFGADTTWPALDSWEMAGAYLLLGMEEVVLRYFDFVQASQREDGNIPLAILPEEEVRPPEVYDGCFKGVRYPEDIYEYTPPDSDYPTRKWIGLFRYWIYEDPLRVLGAVSYILTAAEIAAQTKDVSWVKQKLPSVEKAAGYVLTQKSDQGLIGGAGFYIELIPRKEWDGTTQCYAYHAFCELSALYTMAGNHDRAVFWKTEADALARAFRRCFWRNSHFAEYMHPDFGAVDFHGYTDVDWAAIGFGLADDGQINELWTRLIADKDFWWGGMPTQVVTKPYTFREWEFAKKVPFETNSPIYDMGAIARVWYVEMLACLRMKDHNRVREAVKLVCKMGLKDGGYWYERYHMLPNRTVYPAGPKGYCEYAAILIRLVLGNIDLFI